MGKVKTTVTIDYLWLTLFAFGGFGLEIALQMIEPAGPSYLHHVLTSVLWCSAAIILWQVGKRRFEFDIFKYGPKPGWKRLLVVLALMAVTIGSVTLLWGGWKPVLEYRSAGDLTNFVWQYIYYAFESLLIYVTIAFGQRFGDSVMKNCNIPWGGLALALTWGLIHILTQDFFTGLAAFVWAIIYGSVYLLCKKNPLYVVPAIAVMFIV